MLTRHLNHCADCDAFAVETAEITHSLRTAPQEHPHAPLVVASPRRGSARPAAVLAFAAAAAAAVFAASALQSGSQTSLSAARFRPSASGLALIASGESTLGVRHEPAREINLRVVSNVRGIFGQPV